MTQLDTSFLTGYRFERHLAEALFGQVQLYKHSTTEQMVAVKKVSLACAKRGVTLKCGKKIAEDAVFELGMHRYLQTQRHSQIGKSFVLGMLGEMEMANHLYMIFEYCEQGELFDLVRTSKQGRLEIEQVRVWFRQIVLGVQFLHSCGYAHRDLSLENVLVTSKGVCKICDFGLATYADANCNQAVGKKVYMAPDVAQAQFYDPVKVDIWSLGIMLFTMLAGSPPFDVANASDPRYQVVVTHGVGILLQVWKMSDQIPSVAVDLLDRLLCAHPSERITVDQMLQHPFLTA
nr:protein kinase putative [Albugo laibachii Nc14]|eukprot:CCA25327.1 protein kinase putative [Albugo laibachii Nc14]